MPPSAAVHSLDRRVRAPAPAPRLLFAREAVVLGGIAAGVLDIAAAFTQAGLRGTSPARVLQAIASGVLGTASYEGGAWTVALGLILHFTIAFGAAATFVIAARRAPVLLERAWASGAIFGVMVWAVMRFVVLPISAYPHIQPMVPSRMAVAVAIHIAFVGLPIALIARRTMVRSRGPGR